MKKILLVEDDQFILDLYKRQLENAGFEVVTAEDGEIASQKINENPDLILLDVLLPKKNGLEFLKEIKCNDVFKNIPVILLTNLGQESVVKEGFDSGAAGYLIKSSLTPSEVIRQVSDFLDKKTG